MIEIVIFLGVLIVLVIALVAQGLELRSARSQAAAEASESKPLKLAQPTAAELETQLKSAYETKILEASQALGTDLQATSKRLQEQVSRLTTNVIEEELDAYQKTLEEVRHAATVAMDQIHQAVEHQRVELRKGMEQELAAEKKALVDKFDLKMGDVVASYISESLGSGVDLGAQMKFILASLEAHKEEIKKDLLSGV